MSTPANTWSSGRQPGLYIDTSIIQTLNASGETSLSPNSRLPNDIVPSFLVSESPSASEKRPVSPLTKSFKGPPTGSHKEGHSRRAEVRKLLGHVLNQLSHRTMPPTVYDTFDVYGNGKSSAVGDFVKSTIKGGGNFRSTEHVLEDEDGTDVFSTDETFELMVQLRDVLTMARAQGWKMFDDGAPEDRERYRESGARSSSPFRRSLSSLQPIGRRSRSPSPAFGKQDRDPGLLAKCISILSSIVLEDCRFKVASPRPTRPPNALQAMTLEVARFLLYTHRHSPSTISDIAFALIPAFATFPYEICGRLLAFFEECVVRNALAELRLFQGLDSNSLVEEMSEKMDRMAPGAISIQVDEAPDEGSSGTDSSWAQWSTVLSTTLALRSSNAPMQQRISHLLSSFVKPLLAAALERFEMTTEPHSRGDVTYRLHRLVTVIVDLKFDAYLDILEVLAYHTSNAKRPAAHLLATFWPKAIGHVAISRPPVGPIAEITNGRLFQHSSQSHQFVPWRFGCNRSSTPTSAQEHKCNICTHDIEGFGLFCSLCMCSVHLGCYKFPEGNLFLNHSSKSSQKTKRATLYRFSTIPCRESRERRRDKHCLKPVNLFTLTVCSVCREPLWGCRAQGVHCINCLQFVHASCTTSSSFTVCEVTSGSDSPTSVNISWSSLRQTCMKFYADALSLNPGSLRLKSFEDISSISGTLWTQVQLLENGVTHGTLVVDGAAPRSTDYTTQEFELHHVLFWCTELISSGTLAPSPGTMDYVQYNSIQRQDDSLFFDWSYLIFVSAAIKMPLEPTGNASGGLLPVASPVDSGSVEPRGEDVTHPFEIAPLSHLRDVLGREFYFHCDIAAIFMLSHLHHMGFIERLDSEPLLFEDGNKHTLCTFPLPLGLDVSSDVETLFAAVEASLSDLDLFVNEVGWLLLNRRLWPSGSASEYALGRLMRSILMWILAEDEDLATILRDYLAKQLPLPGVRSINDPAPWPPVHGTRHAPSASVNNGGDYVASRRALVNRYAIPWLAALHNQDSDKYAAILYDICNEVVDNTSQFTWETLQHPEKDPDKYEKTLRLMLRVSHNSIMFSASEALFVRWLRDMGSSRGTPPSLPSLTRIFQREPDSSQRYSILDGSVLLSDALRFEPWSLVADTASESGEGLQISLQWLRIFASSGISIPYITLEQMVNLVGQSEDAALDFTHVLLLTAWQRSPDRERVQKLVATLHSRMHVSFIKSLQKRVEPTQSITILKRSLAVCLLLYGCDREKIVTSGLISEGEMKDLPSRRKSSYQVPAMVDPIVIDPSLMVILEAYMSANNDTISCIIGRFLNCFLMDSPYLEAHEVDNFILRNGRMLCNSAFLFYGIQRQELFALRFGFLLRVVVVDTQPFRELLENLFGSEGDWEFRLAAVRKLFRLILDIKVPAQTVEGRQWRSSITDVFYFFFGSLWRDEKQEIRVAVEILCSTLLPSHFEEISLCWTELFATSPVEERLKLATFLVQLRSQFPSWQVLSWNVILEILAEDHFDQEASNKRDGALSSHLSMYGLTATEEDGNSLSPQGMNNEMTSLRVSILLLSLDMVANGILVDHNDLLRIKLHVARVFGFDDVHAVPAPNGLTFLVKFGKLVSVPQYAIPCISQLLPLLDSPHPAPLISIEPPRGNTTPLLVGAVFIDVLLGLFSSAKEITSLPILSVKSLLESLGEVIYKHNFENIYIRHLQPSLKQAVTLTLELMLEDINYECRQLALYVTQAYIRKFHGTMRSLIHYALEQVAKLVISQSHTTQDPFLDQARSFLENTLQTNGIFVGLIRRKLDRGIFVVLKQVLDANAKEKHGGESLREYLLRDTLPRAVESDRHVFQDVLNNLQTYVEDVHHQNYSKEFMMFVGQHLTLLARRISEWTPDFVSPGPLLNIAAILMQHNKAQSREMLSYTETVLRVALTRLTVDTPTLSRLVHVTSALYKRSDQQGTNIIIMVLFEILSDGLRMKSRVLSETIGALAQTIMTTHAAGVPLTRCYNNLFVGLAGPGLHFLFNHPWGDTRSEKDLKVSLVVAKMVFATVSESDMIAVMAEQGNEKLGRQSMSMRGWNVLVLAMLMEGSESWWDLMFSQLGALSVAHHAALKSYTHPNGTITESAIPDINHAYIAIKLWLMLAQKKSTRIGAGDDFALKVWEHLWPPFEALLSAFAPEVQAGLPMTLALLVWSTVADLFVFVRNLRSSVTLHTSSQLLILEGLKSLGTGSDAQVGKLSRAIRSLNEPPSYLSNEAMIDQVAKDIIATEKLRELDVLSREAAKMIPERRGIRQEYSQGPN